jgi:anti-sigma factor RsiW
MTHDPVHRERGLLGAYLLGQLGKDETELVASHLGRCPSCRQEHESLVSTSDLLKWYVDKGGDL